MRALTVAALAIVSVSQPHVSDDDLARADSAVRQAFAFLYALPSDTAGAAMESWVIDSAKTTPQDERTGHWKIVVTQLTDTGNGLNISEMMGRGGTSPAQLAAAMAEMQKLESKISKSEAEAALEIDITLNPSELVASGVSDDAQRMNPAIPGASLALRVKGDWMRLDDRELEIDFERWSPATLLVAFGAFNAVTTDRVKPAESLATFTATARPQTGTGILSIAVTAQGNEAMLERVIKETKWEALENLLDR